MAALENRTFIDEWSSEGIGLPTSLLPSSILSTQEIKQMIHNIRLQEARRSKRRIPAFQTEGPL